MSERRTNERFFDDEHDRSERTQLESYDGSAEHDERAKERIVRQSEGGRRLYGLKIKMARTCKQLAEPADL